MSLICRLMLMNLLAGSLALSQAPQEQSYFRQAEVHEAEGKIQIVANSPRPLAQVLDALQQKYGWVVDYEDPRFISKVDMVQPTAPATQILPGGGVFRVEFPSNLEEEKILEMVVASYNQSNNPGRFELRKSDQDKFVVVGLQARDSQGRLSRQKPLFDVPITVKKIKRNSSDTLKLICQTLAKRQGIAITLGVMPTSLLGHSEIEVGGTHLAARELLAQSLTLPGHRLYWRLLFDPSSKGYWLDIHLARDKNAPSSAHQRFSNE
jgi:hypothetical protein